MTMVASRMRRLCPRRGRPGADDRWRRDRRGRPRQELAASTSDLPKSLRFHPDCWHPSAQRAPAMVARIDGLPRLAVHRT
ncbi:hypothetical protein DPM13_05135 [Paracoccus mutanolyticus]|uniref:DUF7146 domain-containing protein n=1 Tax=Paracoccus mutanolyticus TaxID=1499308 RepID=A0ABM6WQ75_9RHOB|nr:hypothetical protein DPM13_05135 [Paracoccus mutanolyticus]